MTRFAYFFFFVVVAVITTPTNSESPMSPLAIWPKAPRQIHSQQKRRSGNEDMRDGFFKRKKVDLITHRHFYCSLFDFFLLLCSLGKNAKGNG